MKYSLGATHTVINMLNDMQAFNRAMPTVAVYRVSIITLVLFPLIKFELKEGILIYRYTSKNACKLRSIVRL